MPVSVALHTPTETVSDILIWRDDIQAKASMLLFVSTVCYPKIPAYLVSDGPFDVYTNSLQTELFFFERVVQQHDSTGLLALLKPGDSECYVVFFADASSRIKCFFLDFAIISRAAELLRAAANDHPLQAVFYTNVAIPLKSDTSVFDRVLEHKTARKSASFAGPLPPVPPPSLLLTGSQIASAINRCILSGLRLRGLSSTHKEKVVIQEIYQMTKKAATFAIRKYNYNLGGELKRERVVTLDEIQNIVESLLQAFVDVEPSLFDDQQHGALTNSRSVLA